MHNVIYIGNGYAIHMRNSITLQLKIDFVSVQESSYQYWPPVGQVIVFGENTVDLISEEPLTGFTVRKISVLDNKVYTLWVIHRFYIFNVKSFKDSQGTPSDSVPHHLLDTRWSVLQPEGCGGCDRRSGQSPEENWKQTYTSPLQVRGMCMHLHCNMLCFPNSSDTVTRSGMFCALATVIDRCKTEGIVDVFQVVKALRTCKPGAVPTMVRCFNMIFVVIIGDHNKVRIYV